MATFEQINARVLEEIQQAAQPTLFHNAPGTLGVTFATQDVVVQDGTMHIASDFARVFADDFNTEGVVTNSIGIGHEVVAATIVGSANGALNVTANGSSAELAIFGTQFNDTIVANNPYAISPSITIFAMYNAIREGIVDENGNPISTNPDNAGFRYWQEELEAGRSLNSIAQAFLSYMPGNDNPDNAAFINQVLYNDVLGRDADANGFEYCMNFLNNAAANGVNMLEARANLLTGFVNSQEYLVGKDVGSRALDWSDANGQIMGASLDAFLGAGDDIVYATIGNNNIDMGEGNDQVYLTGYNFGVTNISGVQGFETVRFIEDNADMRITNVTVFNNVDGTATIQLQTNWDATINIFTDGFSADAVARSFGSALPAAGQAVEFNGNWNHFQANALLDFDAEQRIVLTADPVVTPAIIGTDAADALNGDLTDNVIVGLAGNDRLAGHEGNDRIDVGTDNNIAWGGAHNDHLVALGGGKNDLSGEGGEDILVGKVGTTLRGGEHADQNIVGLDNANQIDRAVVDTLEAWDTLQIFGVAENKGLDVKFFAGSKSISVDANGDGKGDLDIFVADDFVFQTLAQRAGAGINSDGFGNIQMTADKFNDTFGTSANGEQVADVGLVGVDANGMIAYTGWHYIPEIA